MIEYVPDAGDVVWLRTAGGHQVVLVISAQAYNRRVGRMLCCPVTADLKGYPFEVPLGGAPMSAALADQLTSLDWRPRDAQLRGRAEPPALNAIRKLAHVLIG
ncbi:toxin MazF [Chimaeribacter californicus]|uniref:Toxin MazF n=1 Tax=Chimaeribacter californicus TaxID=2060067 RepID=A0A2N5DU48_9GAMM|nr:type II toxin-antitoxin system PemK/MazF family toxin [Chimaeribacter californicus]PLR30260.1 toxin MazF [Chimaeribacter californicus]